MIILFLTISCDQVLLVRREESLALICISTFPAKKEKKRKEKL
jgi:hypothetical protein